MKKMLEVHEKAENGDKNFDYCTQQEEILSLLKETVSILYSDKGYI